MQVMVAMQATGKHMDIVKAWGWDCPGTGLGLDLSNYQDMNLQGGNPTASYRAKDIPPL